MQVNNLEEYEVEKILSKIDYPEKKYLVKWEGWDIKDSTWETIENLKNSLELVEEFEKNQAIKNFENNRKRGEKKRDFHETKEFEIYTRNKRKNILLDDNDSQENEYEENVSKKIKRRKKYENILSEFPEDEEVEFIKTVRLIKDQIHCLVSWKANSMGIQLDECLLPSKVLAEKIPIMLIVFYETKIKFI